jgi:hypothetical protein
VQPPKGVLQRPYVGDLAVAEPDDPDLIDSLEATPGWGMAEPVAQVGRRASELADDHVAFGDQLHDLDVDVGEAGLKGATQRLAAPASSGA